MKYARYESIETSPSYRERLKRRKVVFTLKIAETKLMRLTMKSSEARSDHELTKVEKNDTSHLDVESKESL